MSSQKNDRGRWLQWASKGMGAVLGPMVLAALAGPWIDQRLQLSKPWVTVSLLTLGAVAGLASLIKMAKLK